MFSLGEVEWGWERDGTGCWDLWVSLGRILAVGEGGCLGCGLWDSGDMVIWRSWLELVLVGVDGSSLQFV